MKTLTSTFIACAVCIFLSGCLRPANLHPYAGVWVLRSSGKSLMLLDTHVQNGELVGTLTTPLHFTEESEGAFSEIHGPIVLRHVVGKRKKNSVQLLVGTTPDRDKIPMTLQDKQHAQLHWAEGKVPPWQLERALSKHEVITASDWPE